MHSVRSNHLWYVSVVFIIFLMILTRRPVDPPSLDKLLEQQALKCRSIHYAISQAKQHHIMIEHELCNLIPAKNTAIIAQVLHNQLNEDQDHANPEQGKEAEEGTILGGSMSPIECGDWEKKV